MINSCTFIGRVSTEIELKKTKNDISYCRFQLAVKRLFNPEQTDYPQLKAYGKLAEMICLYVNKGDMLGVRSRFLSSIKDGKKFYEFRVEEIQFLENKKTEGDNDDIEIPLPKSNSIDSDYFDRSDDLPF